MPSSACKKKRPDDQRRLAQAARAAYLEGRSDDCVDAAAVTALPGRGALCGDVAEIRADRKCLSGSSGLRVDRARNRREIQSHTVRFPSQRRSRIAGYDALTQ